MSDDMIWQLLLLGVRMIGTWLIQRDVETRRRKLQQPDRRSET
jgi:hypothetical protein